MAEQMRVVSSSLLTEDDLQELRLIFDAFDHDSDGLLDVDEVGTLLQSFGKPMTEAEVRRSLTWEHISPPATRPRADAAPCHALGIGHGDGAQTRLEKVAL